MKQLYLDGRNRARLPSPTVNGNHMVFRDNDITTRNTTICFVLGSDEYGRAVRTVIERNRIHNCGELPPTNHHHGIYVEASDGARITDNWIYDNADRGVQLFPDAQRTYVARNVIDGNGEGIVFSRRSAHNVVEHNVIANSIVRYNVEDFELSGSGNVVRRNCLWSPLFGGNAVDLTRDRGRAVRTTSWPSPATSTAPARTSACARTARASASRRARGAGASVDARPRCSGGPVTPHERSVESRARGLGLGLQHVGADRQPGQDSAQPRRAPRTPPSPCGSRRSSRRGRRTCRR